MHHIGELTDSAAIQCLSQFQAQALRIHLAQVTAIHRRRVSGFFLCQDGEVGARIQLLQHSLSAVLGRHDNNAKIQLE